jgi:hypothetical protein
MITSKQVRTRLGGDLVDLKHVDSKVFLIEKVGEDDFVSVLTSARFLRKKELILISRKNCVNLLLECS